jgi:hypothetical protein
MSYQAPVLNGGYYDIPIQNAYSNPNMMSGSYPMVPSGEFNSVVQNNYPMGGYTVQPSNLETFVGSRESSYKYISNSGYNNNPYALSINHSNDQFPAQVYTSTGVQLRVDPRMSSSKIEDAAYKAKTQGYGGGYAQQFAPNNPFTMPQMGMGMNYHNSSSGMGMWSFEPPYAEPFPTFPAVPAQVFHPMMGGGGQPHMNQGVQRPTPGIRIKDADEDEDEDDDEVEVAPKKRIIKRVKEHTLIGKMNAFLTDNTTIYWLIVLLVILLVAFVVKSVYVDK